MHTLESKIKLKSGVSIPYIGIGTKNLIMDEQGYVAVMHAIKNGVRLIDTCPSYDNEMLIQQAIKSCKLNREELFIVNKLNPAQHGYDNTIQEIKNQLAAIKTPYFDLYLIQPQGGQIIQTWSALIEMQQQGKLKAIGVSNFGIDQLDNLISIFPTYPPDVNQIEVHCWSHQQDLLNYMYDNEIQAMAYSPMAQQKNMKKTQLLQLSHELNKSEQQICLRWLLQNKIIGIPKSSNAQHILNNLDIFDFELSDETMDKIRQIDDGFKSNDYWKNQNLKWEKIYDHRIQ